MRKMKKLALMIITALLASFCVLGATACDNILDRGDRDDSIACTHEWEQLEIGMDELECGKAATVWMECKACGEKKTETVEQLDHAWVTYKKVDPTCTTDGRTAYTQCARCDAYKNDKKPTTIKKTDHNYGGKVATCQAGVTCLNCGVYQEKLDHTPQIVQVDAQEATCGVPGWAAYEKCELCTYSTKQADIIVNHNYVSKAAQAATCTEDGWSAYRECDKCGDEQGKVIEPALGHDGQREGQNGVFANAASKPANCKEGIFCGYCEEHYGEKHNHESQILVFAAKAATCTVDGHNEYEMCTYEDGDYVCGYTTKVVERATGHDYGVMYGETGEIQFAYADSKLPTCTKAAYCGKCDQYYGVALGHDGYREGDNGEFKNANSKAADCETQAYCGICEISYGLPLGHLNVKVEGKKPTCDEAGWRSYVECKRCDYNTYEENKLAKLEHNWEIIEAVAPTCDTVGYTEGKECTLCGAKVVPQEIKALDHIVGTATCAEELICGREGCNEVLKAAGVHTNVVPVPGYAATCKDKGLTDGEKCEACGETVTAQEDIDEVPCNSDGVIKPIEATATTAGKTQGSYCTWCNDKVTVEPKDVAAHEHNFENGTCTFEDCAKAEDGHMHIYDATGDCTEEGCETHMHIYNEGECVCGAADPNYVPPTNPGDEGDD